MNINVKNRFTSVTRTHSLPVVVEGFLSSDHHDHFQRLQQRVANLTTIVVFLLERTKMSDEELTELLGQWNETLEQEAP